MKFVEKCRFLKIDLAKSKEGKEYGIVALLDSENNSYKFFVFENIKDKFIQARLQDFQQIECVFEASTIKDGWSVRLLDFAKAENNGNK